MFHSHSKNSRSKQRRTRTFESLERREMMAVDVVETLPFAAVEPQIAVCNVGGEFSQAGVAGPLDCTAANMPAKAGATSPVTPLGLVALDNNFSDARNLGTVHGMQSFSDWVGNTDTRDNYRFTLDDTANVTLRLEQLSADIDLYLYNASGQEMARSWRGGSSHEQIERSLGAGTYYARVSRYGSAQSNYRFSLEVDLAGESVSTARDLGTVHGVHSFSDWAGGLDSNDYYRLVLNNAADVSLRLAQLTADIDLYLYDANGQEIAASWRGGSANELIEQSLGAGTYYVRVMPWGAAESNYRLTLDVDVAGEDFSTARNLGAVRGSHRFSDWVGRLDTNDCFRFALAQTGDVTLRLDQLSADIDLYLYDGYGNEIARSWLGGTSDELYQQTLGTGTYYIAVSPWLSNESTYRLSVDVDLVDDGNNGGGDQQPLPDVPYFGGANDWNLNAVNAPEAWAQGYTGAGVIVAVIDTGVDYYHSELAGNIWTNDDIAGNGIDDDGNGYVDDYRGWDFAYGDNDPRDIDGHGTHVSGTIAAANNGLGATGVAFGALIMPVQVLDNSGWGSWDAVAAGIRYAVENGANVINLSLGGGYSTAVASALAYANQRGVFVAAAAGNDGASTPGYPAYHSVTLGNVLSVGAHDRNNSLASFSNRVGHSGAVQIDAPGAGVFSCVPGNSYDTWNGTSMASPHVAGVAALVLGANPNLTPSQLRQLLVDGATRTIYRSDSAGGLNSAVSVAMALNTTAQAFEVRTESVPVGGVQLASVSSIRAVDSLHTSDLNYMPAARIDSPSAVWEARMASMPVAGSQQASLRTVAMEVHSAGTDSDRIASVDVAFESLWDEMELELASLQLV
jgi:hypothetical protein